MVMNIKSYFQRADVSSTKHAGSFYVHCHVQQKSEQEGMWNLNPKFVLSGGELAAESSSYIGPAEWICSRTTLEPIQDDGKVAK